MNSSIILTQVVLLVSIVLLLEARSYKRDLKLSRKIGEIRLKRQSSSSRIRPSPEKIPYASLSTGSIPDRVRYSSSRKSSSRSSSIGSSASTSGSSSDSSPKSPSPALPSSSQYGSFAGSSGTGLGGSNPYGSTPYGGNPMQSRYGSQYGQQQGSGGGGGGGGMRIPYGRSTYPYVPNNQAGGYGGYQNQYVGPVPNPFGAGNQYGTGYQQTPSISGYRQPGSGYPHTYGQGYMGSGYQGSMYGQPMMPYGSLTPSYYGGGGGFSSRGHPYYSGGTSIGSPYRHPSVGIPDPSHQRSYGGSSYTGSSSSYHGSNPYGSTSGYGGGTGTYSSSSSSRYPYSSSQYPDGYGSYGSDDSSYGGNTGGGYGQSSGSSNAGPPISGSETGDSGSYGQYPSSGTYDPPANSQYSNYGGQSSSDSSGVSRGSPSYDNSQYPPHSGQSYGGGYDSSYGQSSGSRYGESPSVGVGYSQYGQDSVPVASSPSSTGSRFGSYGGGYGSEDGSQGLGGSPTFAGSNSESVSGSTGSESSQSFGYYNPIPDQSSSESSQPYQTGQFYSPVERQGQSSQIAYPPESSESANNQISQGGGQPIAPSRSGENSGRDVSGVSRGDGVPILVQQRMRQIERNKIMRQNLRKPHSHPSMRKCEKRENGLPDLFINPAKLRTSLHLDLKPLHKLSCAKGEGCLAKSAYTSNPALTRRLLRFATVAQNKGTAVFRPSLPPDQWVYHECHKHKHSSEEFAHYNLINANGTFLAEGHKASFCLEDSGCKNPCTPKFNCTSGEQGISPGCYDTYLASRDCQWIDVTDVRPGEYTLRVTVNPLINGVRKSEELSYDNNVVDCKVSIRANTAEAHDCRFKSR